MGRFLQFDGLPISHQMAVSVVLRKSWQRPPAAAPILRDLKAGRQHEVLLNTGAKLVFSRTSGCFTLHGYHCTGQDIREIVGRYRIMGDVTANASAFTARLRRWSSGERMGHLRFLSEDMARQFHKQQCQQSQHDAVVGFDGEACLWTVLIPW